MSDLIVWGDKPKSAVDPSTVDQEIDLKIQDHLDDPDAHLEVGQSLQSHKASEIIDHLARSIVTDKIKELAVTPVEQNPTAKFGDCVVAPADGDYTTIQDALAAGHKKIYIKSGTYIITDDIVLESGVQLIGENRESTVLDFDNSSNIISVLGSEIANPIIGVYIRDLTIANCSLYGIHLNNCRDIYIEHNIFDNCVEPVYCNIDDIGINDANSIYVRDNYFAYCEGFTFMPDYGEYIGFSEISGNLFVDCSSPFFEIRSWNSFSTLFFRDNCIFYNELQTSGICLDAVLTRVENNYFYNAYDAIYANAGFIQNNIIYTCGHNGITGGDWYTAILSNVIFHFAACDNTHGYGIDLSWAESVVVSNNMITTSNNYAIYCDRCEKCTINSNSIFDNTHGIRLTSNSSYNIILGNVIDVSGTPISDSGTSNEIAHNVVA